MAHSGIADGDTGAAVPAALSDQPDGAGVVCPDTRASGALPAVRALECGIDAGTADVSGAGRAKVLDAAPGVGMVGRIRGVRTSVQRGGLGSARRAADRR